MFVDIFAWFNSSTLFKLKTIEANLNFIDIEYKLEITILVCCVIGND